MNAWNKTKNFFVGLFTLIFVLLNFVLMPVCALLLVFVIFSAFFLGVFLPEENQIMRAFLMMFGIFLFAAPIIFYDWLQRRQITRIWGSPDLPQTTHRAVQGLSILMADVRKQNKPGFILREAAGIACVLAVLDLFLLWVLSVFAGIGSRL